MANRFIKVLEDVEYQTDADMTLLANVYLPQQNSKQVGILLIHGGAWQTGSKDRLHQWGCFLAEQGYTAMAVNYRLSKPNMSTWPAVLYDIQASYDFFIKHADEWQINRDQIGVIGASAGAHLATLFALAPPKKAMIKAVVGVYGVYDLKSWRTYTQQVRDDDPVGKMMGNTPEQAPQEYHLASPIYQIKPNLSTRFFIIWGEDDEIVPCEDQSVLFVQKLKEANISVETLSIPGQGHFWFYTGDHESGVDINEYPNNQVKQDILRFLDKSFNF